MVIVASRPVATQDIKEICTKHAEVIGFSKDQISKYVETYPFDTDSLNIVFKLKNF